MPHHVAEEELGIRADEPLGKAPGLGEEVPVVAPHRGVAVDAHELLVGGHDVEDGELAHSRRVVERHAIGHAPPAVVAGHEERREAELLHHLHLVGGHRALAVSPAVLGIGRV